jgi:ferredoxin-NADP reductase
MPVTTETRLLEVTGRRPVAEGVVELELSGPNLPAWSPGAHVDLLLAPGLVRQYSLSGGAADRYRVAVLREPAGRGGSAFVHDRLRVGSRVEVGGPRNHFPLAPAPAYLFVAGGIGITPILPMLAAAEAAGAQWRLLYGGRRRASMAYLERLDDPRVTVHPQDEHGLLDLAGAVASAPPDAAVHACGPEPMLAALEAVCPPERLHVERFTAPPVTGPDRPFDVTLGRSGTTVHVPAGTSVLAAVEAAGADVLQSCREGTCGTCETAVLAGEPDHRDAVLDEAERASGATMMICVSRSRCPLLVLDL